MTGERPAPAPEDDRMPFKSPRQIESGGHFSDLYEIEGRGDFVVKEVGKNFRGAESGLIDSDIQTISRDLKSIEKTGLKRFVPESHLVKGEKKPGQPRFYIATEKIAGRTLEEAAEGGTHLPPEIARELDELLTEHVNFFISTYDPEKFAGRSLDLEHFERNIMVGRNLKKRDTEDKAYFVDVFPIFDSNPNTMISNNLAIRRYLRGRQGIELPKLVKANKRLEDLMLA